MKSYDVMKDAVDKVGAKAVAGALNVSTSLVYKWCEKPPQDEEEEASGARNPLDRLHALIECTGDNDLIAWLCEQEKGFFVSNPVVDTSEFNREFIMHTQRMINEFSDLLHIMSESIANEDRIDSEESKRIRREWEQLKRYAESFVCGCEQGLFYS